MSRTFDTGKNVHPRIIINNMQSSGQGKLNYLTLFVVSCYIMHVDDSPLLGIVTTQLPGINDYCGGKVVFIDTEVCYSNVCVSFQIYFTFLKWKKNTLYPGIYIYMYVYIVIVLVNVGEPHTQIKQYLIC